MLKVDRIGMLIRMLNTIDDKRIDGRKKFHKLIYLLQDRGIDFGQGFIFHNYGVYSPSLAMDLTHACHLEGLKEEEKEKETGGYKYYEYSLGDDYKDFLDENEPEDLRIDENLKRLLELDTPVLEVLSTIVYLDKKGYRGEKLEGTLGDLKGHLKKYFPEAYKAAGEFYSIKA